MRAGRPDSHIPARLTRKSRKRELTQEQQSSRMTRSTYPPLRRRSPISARTRTEGRLGPKCRTKARPGRAPIDLSRGRGGARGRELAHEGIRPINKKTTSADGNDDAFPYHYYYCCCGHVTAKSANLSTRGDRGERAPVADETRTSHSCHNAGAS